MLNGNKIILLYNTMLKVKYSRERMRQFSWNVQVTVRIQLISYNLIPNSDFTDTSPAPSEISLPETFLPQTWNFWWNSGNCCPGQWWKKPGAWASIWPFSLTSYRVSQTIFRISQTIFRISLTIFIISQTIFKISWPTGSQDTSGFFFLHWSRPQFIWQSSTIEG